MPNRVTGALTHSGAFSVQLVKRYRCAVLHDLATVLALQQAWFGNSARLGLGPHLAHKRLGAARNSLSLVVHSKASLLSRVVGSNSGGAGVLVTVRRLDAANASIKLRADTTESAPAHIVQAT